MNLAQYHNRFPGSVLWRITPQGLEVQGSGLIKPSFDQLNKATHFTTLYADDYAAASKEYGVPVELLIACSMTESASKNAETCVREEPGYVKVAPDGRTLTQAEADNLKPNRISAGFCQLLISTAREVMRNPRIDRQWLFNVRNSLRACANYIRFGRDKSPEEAAVLCSACEYSS